MVLYLGGLFSGCYFFRVVFFRLVFFQGCLFQGGLFQGGLSGWSFSGWSFWVFFFFRVVLSRVLFFFQGGIFLRVIFFRVVYFQGGLFSRWSCFSRWSFLRPSFFTAVFYGFVSTQSVTVHDHCQCHNIHVKLRHDKRVTIKLVLLPLGSWHSRQRSRTLGNSVDVCSTCWVSQCHHWKASSTSRIHSNLVGSLPLLLSVTHLAQLLQRWSTTSPPTCARPQTPLKRLRSFL